MKTRSDFEGLEFDWFAMDQEGFIALMGSAGSGLIPDRVFDRYDEQCRLHDALRKYVGLRSTDDWTRFARLLSEAGIFVYDCKGTKPPYRQVATPARPLVGKELGIDQQLLESLVPLSLRFGSSKGVPSEVLMALIND